MLSWAASFGGRFRRGNGPGAAASIEGQGAPAGGASLCAAVGAGDVTLGPGRGIILVEREWALGGSVDGFDGGPNHALGKVLATPLTGRSNYRLERHAGSGFDRSGRASMTSIKCRPDATAPARAAQPHR